MSRKRIHRISNSREAKSQSWDRYWAVLWTGRCGMSYPWDRDWPASSTWSSHWNPLGEYPVDASLCWFGKNETNTENTYHRIN